MLTKKKISVEWCFLVILCSSISCFSFLFSMNVCWGWSWISVGIQQNVFGPIACVVK
jgi:hypothetical protein